MTQIEFIKHIVEEFNWLINLGYNISQIDRNILFEKESDDSTTAIKFHWAEYDVIKIQGLVCLKRFKKVEQIIADTLERNMDYTIKKIYSWEVPKELYPIANEHLIANSILISNEHHVKIFSDIVRTFFETEASPFFIKFNTLSNIIEEMNELPSDQKAAFIVNTSNSTFLRIFAIKYCKNPDEGLNFYEATLNKLEPNKKERSIALILKNIHILKIKITKMQG